MLKPWSRFLPPALLALLLPAFGMAQISVDVSVNVPPPELPVQPSRFGSISGRLAR